MVGTARYLQSILGFGRPMTTLSSAPRNGIADLGKWSFKNLTAMEFLMVLSLLVGTMSILQWPC